VIDCEFCGKRHRTEEQIAKCKARAERAVALANKRETERLRREHNLEKIPVSSLVRQMRRFAGEPYEKIVARLKKDYPPPYDTWGVYEVVEEYAKLLNWPAPLPLRVVALLEKHYLGAYITYHPISGVLVGGMAPAPV